MKEFGDRKIAMDIQKTDEMIRTFIRGIKTQDDGTFTDSDLVDHIETNVCPECSTLVFDCLRGYYTTLICDCDVCCIKAWLDDPRNKFKKSP